MLELIPKPQTLIRRDGFVRLPKQLGICLNGFSAHAAEAFLARSGLCAADGNFLTVERDASLLKEEYRLLVRQDGISIRAAEERGVIWALTTLVQLIGNGSVPCLEIADRPKYSHRGVNLDCTRHFFPADEVKRIVEGISLVKMNVLHWHLSDDQGWRIESKVFPRLNEVGGPYYTQEEIKEVVAFAKARGVDVVPEIDMPGHMSALLAAYPELSCSGEPYRNGDFCIGNEEDAQLCLGFKPDADVEGGNTEAEGYKGIFKGMMDTFGFKYVVSTLRESLSATHNVT